MEKGGQKKAPLPGCLKQRKEKNAWIVAAVDDVLAGMPEAPRAMPAQPRRDPVLENIDAVLRRWNEIAFPQEAAAEAAERLREEGQQP